MAKRSNKASLMSLNVVKRLEMMERDIEMMQGYGN